MDESRCDSRTKKRRWLQFGLRWFFVATLVVAAFFAGRASSIRHTEEAWQREVDARITRVLGYRLYEDQDAQDVLTNVERLTDDDENFDGGPMPKREVLKLIDVDVDRLPELRTEFELMGEYYVLSPSYVLYLEWDWNDRAMICGASVDRWGDDGSAVRKLLYSLGLLR